MRGWTHLERQKGGIGLRGPGETQLETDRRLLAGRIKQIRNKLERVRRQREQSRQARRKAQLPTIALVGYTNAGKSTLFNRLCDAGVQTTDQLFATLDTTLRRLQLAPGMTVIVADTVGFVRDLPHELVAAFRATLQETRDACLLLHVIDAADPARAETIERVSRVLHDIGADEQPLIEVYNKSDLIGMEAHYDPASPGYSPRVWMSARTGEGVAHLIEALRQHFIVDMVHGRLHLNPVQGRLRARLFELGAVLGERIDEKGEYDLEVCLPQSKLDVLLEQSPGVNANLRSL